MEDSAQIREKLQKQIVEIITTGLETGTISEERAKEIAKFVLDALPEGIKYPELIAIIPKLDDEFRELSAVVVPFMSEYEKKVKEAVNVQISALIQSGKIDEALQLTKKAIAYETKLS